MGEPNIRSLNIAYIGGGSKGWAWGLMGDLAMEPELAGTVKLYDIHYPAAKKNEIIGNRISARHDAVGEWRYEAVPTLQEALEGADFVVISILPGTFQEMASDVHLPERLGIYQSVGDTTGPGGLVRALRTIPMYVQIADSIKQFAPDAWVINYTNPMSLCVRTLYEVFPQIKAFGCCHEVFGTQELLAHMLKELKQAEGVTRQDIQINVLGINHFTWIDQASYKNIDLMPLYAEFVDRFYESGYEETGSENWMNSYFSSAHRVKFDLFKRYGLIAAAGDRHLAEFVPWYLRSTDTVREWKFNLTPVSWRMERKNELDDISNRLEGGVEQPGIRGSGEEGLLQMKALLGMGEFVTNINLPNVGQIQGLPTGAVVETNAVIAFNSVRPVIAGTLPPDVQNLVIRHVLNQETTLQAALNRDKDLAFRAFLNDPLMTSDIDAARALFDDMLQNTKSYLPGWELG